MLSLHCQFASEGRERRMGSYRCVVMRWYGVQLWAGLAGVPVPATRQRRHVPTRKTRDAQTRATIMSPPAGLKKMPLAGVPPTAIVCTTRASNSLIFSERCLVREV